MKLRCILLSSIFVLCGCSLDSSWDPRNNQSTPAAMLVLGTDKLTDKDISSEVLETANMVFDEKAKHANGHDVSKQPARLALVQDLKDSKRFLSFPYEDSAKVLLIEASGNYVVNIAGPSGTQVPNTFHRLSMLFHPETGVDISSELSP